MKHLAYLLGEPESDVSANFYHGIMTARIMTKDDIYVIEVRKLF